jgi:hypothetical protein
MPLKRGKDSVGKYFSWGSHGHKYHYHSKKGRKLAKKKAIKQAVAIGYRKARGY